MTCLEGWRAVSWCGIWIWTTHVFGKHRSSQLGILRYGNLTLAHCKDGGKDRLYYHPQRSNTACYGKKWNILPSCCMFGADCRCWSILPTDLRSTMHIMIAREMRLWFEIDNVRKANANVVQFSASTRTMHRRSDQYRYFQVFTSYISAESYHRLNVCYSHWLFLEQCLVFFLLPCVSKNNSNILKPSFPYSLSLLKSKFRLHKVSN